MTPSANRHEKSELDPKREELLFANRLQDFVYAVEIRNVQRMAVLSDALTSMYLNRGRDLPKTGELR